MAKNKQSISEKILKRKKDPKLLKQLDLEQIDFNESEDVDEVQKIVQSSKIQKKIEQKKKKLSRLIIGTVAALFLGYGMFLLLKPFEAGMDFGFCRVFLELHVQYPQHLVLSDVDERRDFIRIWYMQTDSFGQERLQNIECYHGQDPERGYYISKVRIDRREIDPEKVSRFNISLAAIVANPPDLVYPRRLVDALGNMDIQTYLFRKKIF